MEGIKPSSPSWPFLGRVKILRSSRLCFGRGDFSLVSFTSRRVLTFSISPAEAAPRVPGAGRLPVHFRGLRIAFRPGVLGSACFCLCAAAFRLAAVCRTSFVLALGAIFSRADVRWRSVLPFVCSSSGRS